MNLEPGQKQARPRPAAVGLGHPTRFLPNPRAPFSAVRTPATGAWTDLPSGQIRPGSLPDCIRARHDGRKSKYAALGLIWRRFRLRIRVRRGSMARGSMARGSMARGSMARGSMARGSMARGSMARGSMARGSMARGSMARGSMARGSMAQTNRQQAGLRLTLDRWLI